MTPTLQGAFAPIRKYLGPRIANPIRGFATGVLTPILSSYRTGHFVSSVRAKAVRSNGEPLPWYTYPAIDFLRHRTYADKRILEFGGGQSTLWWAGRARGVVSFEGDPAWFAEIAAAMPPNVDLRLVTMASADACVAEVEEQLGEDTFDVIVIDGLYRSEMVEPALRAMADDGVIICDNAEGYGFFEAFRASGLNRVDFFGNAPGVLRPHATSMFFRPGSYLFSAKHPIPPMD